MGVVINPTCYNLQEMKNRLSSQYDLALFDGSESPDLVGMFLKDVRQVPLLTADEEIQLANQIKAAKTAKKKILSSNNLTYTQKEKLISQIEYGRDAFNLLITANSRLVISVAKKYTWTGLSLMDLIQEGHIGLIKAIEKYDHKLGYRFSTYAKWWIWQTISRGIASSGRTIRLPAHLMDEVIRYVKTRSVLTNQLGRYPTEEEICKAMKISEKKLDTILAVSQKITSLDVPVKDENRMELGELIADDRVSIEDDISVGQLKEIMKEGLSLLNANESKVLIMLYGLGDGEIETLETVGKKLHLSKERVRQIREHAIKNLKQWAINRELDTF
jgi:RNA polymerase primary sigma factor